MEECEGKRINNKNDRIDEETSEGDNSDSVIPTVNDEEVKSLTIPVGIQKGGMDRGAAEEKDEDNERTDDEMETEIPVLTPPVDMEECVGKKQTTRMIEQMKKQVKVKFIFCDPNSE